MELRIDGKTVNEIYNEFKKLYDESYQSTEECSHQLATEVSSKSSEEKSILLDRIPSICDWIGSKIDMLELSGQTQTIVNKQYEISINYEKDTSFIAAMQLGVAAKKWKENLIIDALVQGEVNIPYGDVPFFSENHAENQSNLFTGTLDDWNIQQCINRMRKYIDNQGERFNIIADTLVISPQQEQRAVQFIKDLTEEIKIITLPKLAAHPNEWYLLATKNIKPFIMQVRSEVKLKMYLEVQKESTENVRCIFILESRGNAGYGPWFTAIKSK